MLAILDGQLERIYYLQNHQHTNFFFKGELHSKIIFWGMKLDIKTNFSSSSVFKLPPPVKRKKSSKNSLILGRSFLLLFIIQFSFFNPWRTRRKGFLFTEQKFIRKKTLKKMQKQTVSPINQFLTRIAQTLLYINNTLKKLAVFHPGLLMTPTRSAMTSLARPSGEISRIWSLPALTRLQSRNASNHA